MKTAISVPGEIFEEAAGRAAELGISRSEFFARAARRYFDELAAQSLTRQTDQALKTAGDDDSGVVSAAAGRRLPTGSGGRGLVTRRGDVCWAGLGEPRGSKPAKRRPVLSI